jgi:tetratricopeptide (TPR) repeat protein
MDKDSMASGDPRQNPTLAQAVDLLRAGKIAEAHQICARLLAANPTDGESAHLLGFTALRLGRPAEAVEAFERAVVLQPDNPELFNNRGNGLKALGRLEQALVSYRRALALSPRYAEAMNNAGVALHDLQRDGEALAFYQQALALRPDYLIALANRGDALKALGRLEEGLASYDAALAIQPNLLPVLNNRGNLLRLLGRPEAALVSLDKALTLRPDDPRTLTNRGAAYKAMMRYEEAVADYDRALAIAPNLPETLSNRGVALEALGRFDEALASYDQALAVQPDHMEAVRNRGLLRLLTGFWQEGWASCESRRRVASWVPRDFSGPELERLEDARRARVLVYAEQGLGDTIQFARFAQRLAEAGAEAGAAVTLDVQAPLVGLLSDLANVTVVTRAGPPPAFDFHVPLMSLPRLMEATPQTLGAEVPYLAADPARAADWARRLDGEGFKVGVAWQGNPKGEIDLGRSIPLAAFAGLAGVPGVRLISLQKGFGAEQLESPPDGMVVETLGEAFDSGDQAFLDTVAVMANLDLVITSDTAIAHLAGAMGRPVWVVLKSVPDWRWGLQDETSPWYPTARLFRQTARGDWAGVFDHVVAALKAEAATGGAG